jgi:predicted ATPase
MTDSQKFADLFKNVARTPNHATAINVSANGTTTVSPESLAETLRDRFAELHDDDARPDVKNSAGGRE